MSERPVEERALAVMLATLRGAVYPELSSPWARDRAKRLDAALQRLVAGYELLPALRREYAEAYAGLVPDVAGDASGLAVTAEANPVFVGDAALAARIEAKLQAMPEGDALDRYMGEIARLESDCRNDYERRVAALASGRSAEAARSKPVTVEAMQAYLLGHPSAGANVRVTQVHEIPGGRSKRTVLVTLDPSGSLPREVVLRIDAGRAVGTSVLQEFPILDRVAKRGLPVPEPLWLEADEAHFGFPFIVFRRMPGASAGDLIEGAFRKEPATARSLARALAQVHAAGHEFIDDPGRRGPAKRHTQELLDHYFHWWRDHKPFPSLVIETAFRWLYRGLERGLGTSTIVHADTGFHNLLIDDRGLGCLLDWEFSHFGDPAEDLASCRPAVERCMPWADFMTEYCSHGGQPVSDFRLSYFEVWRPLRNAVLCGAVLHALMQGEADDIDPVTIALSTFMKLQADLARSLDSILNPRGGGSAPSGR